MHRQFQLARSELSQSPVQARHAQPETAPQRDEHPAATGMKTRKASRLRTPCPEAPQSPTRLPAAQDQPRSRWTILAQTLLGKLLPTACAACCGESSRFAAAAVATKGVVLELVDLFPPPKQQVRPQSDTHAQFETSQRSSRPGRSRNSRPNVCPSASQFRKQFMYMPELDSYRLPNTSCGRLGCSKR